LTSRVTSITLLYPFRNIRSSDIFVVTECLHLCAFIRVGCEFEQYEKQILVSSII